MENVIFNDYASWLVEYDELLTKIKEDATFIHERYKYIFNVLIYIYNKKIDNKDLISNDELDIFVAGFNFLFAQIESINILLKTVFKDNIKELHKEKKAVSLFLDIQEFISDLETFLEEDKIKPLQRIEEEVYNSFKNKQTLREDIFEEFNITSMNIYRENEIEFYPLKEIFYDIADIYDLI